MPTRLATMLERPEQTLNVVLLLVLVTQLTERHAARCAARGHRRHARRPHRHRAADRRSSSWSARSRPKTYAIQNTERAAMHVTPLLWFLTNLPPLRVLSRGLIGFANVVLPGKGLKQGPFITEEEIRTMADVAAEEDSIARRGAQAHPLDLRVRRHPRARGDAAAARHRGGGGRPHHRRGDRGRDRRRLLAPSRVRGRHRQHRGARVPQGPRPPRRAPARASTRCARR